MTSHSNVPPDTLGVDLVDGGIVVSYNDDREVFYRGVPETIGSPHQTSPGKAVHVLVVAPSETRGTLLYVDERRTEDDILESSGVGRVLLDQGEASTLFPGVTVSRGTHRYEVAVDFEAVDGRVFVFEEDQFEEYSYELVAKP